MPIEQEASEKAQIKTAALKEKLAKGNVMTRKCVSEFKSGDAADQVFLVQKKAQASRLRGFAAIEEKLGIQYKAYDFRKHGEHADMLLGWKRKLGDITEVESSGNH